jgi:hypothetical protein
MANVKHAQIEIYTNDPEATAESVCSTFFPIFFGICHEFDDETARAVFIEHFSVKFAGGLAAEVGGTSAARMFELFADSIRSQPRVKKTH